MATPRDQVHFLKIPVPPEFGDDGIIEVTRTAAVLRRVESRFGPVDPLARRLASASVTLAELQTLIAVLIEDVPTNVYDVPTHKQIGDWLFEIGTLALPRRLADELYTLIIGSEALAALLRNARAREGAPPVGEVANDERPFVRMAASTGAGG